jgi:hypothetical protein
MESISENLNFKSIHNLKWHPFIGNNYFNISEENKMLIVGESHYNDGTEKSKQTVDDVDFTKDMIQENAIEDEDWGTKIIPNFHKAMFGDNDFDAEKFWNLVSYYNFIQRPMQTIGERPSPNDFSEGWKTFFDLIKVIRPKTCLFIGVLASNQLMSAISESNFICKEFISGEKINRTHSRKVTLLDSENNEINILFIQHTSQYFSWSNWNDYLKSELSSQLNWFVKNIDISETKVVKEKLNEIYKAIDIKQLEEISDEFKCVAPAKSGDFADCFTLVINVDKYSLAYEIDIENLEFCSYHYDTNAKKPIPLLMEKGIKGLSHNRNKDPREIAAEITEEILKIISILKEETK